MRESSEEHRTGADGVAGVRLHRRGPVVTVVLDAPHRRNAQTPSTWRELARIGRELPGDVRVVVLRAEGPSFSAGLDRAVLAPGGVPDGPDLLDLARADDATLDAALARHQEAFTWWRRNDLITVAAVAGHAIGAGLQLALACDLRVLADDARLAVREPALGLVPDLGGTHPLVHLVGYARALEICATGRLVGAAEAERIGLANLVVPRAELEAATDDLVAAVLAVDRDALVETKALLRGAVHRDYDAQCAAERAAQARRLRALAGLGE